MGFFKKRPGEIFEFLNPEIRYAIFPGGEPECAKVVESIRSLMGYAEKDVEIVKIYTGLQIRCSGDSSPESIKTRTKIKHSNLTNDLLVYRLIAFTQLHLKNSDFAISSQDDFQLIDLLAISYMEAEKSKATNDVIANNSEDSDDYGLSVDNPVFVPGIHAGNKYLEKVVTLDGLRCNWRRVGSTASEKVSGQVDVYSSNIEGLNKQHRIYINIYSNTTPIKPPHGFRLLNEQEVNEMQTISEKKLEESVQVVKNEKQVEKVETDETLIMTTKNNQCPHCQKIIEEDSNFCVHCGERLSNPDSIKEDITLPDTKAINDTQSAETLLVENKEYMNINEMVPNEVKSNKVSESSNARISIVPTENTDSINPKRSNVEILKEMKELLDLGIVTQEEMDRKKKELLNL